MSKIRDPQICILLGPHFIRLAANAGFTYGLFEASQKGLIPTPNDIKGVSAGGIIATCFGPWTEESANATLNRISELSGKDFYGINKELEFWGVLEVMGALSPLIPWNKIEKTWVRNAAKLATAGAFAGLEGQFIRKLFVCRSVFSNDKLLNLLMKSVDFKGLFRSPVRIEIISADLNGDKDDGLRVKPVSVTNFKPEDKGDIRKFARGVVTSASVTGFFPTHLSSENHFLTDGAIYSAFPVDLAYNQGADVIVVVRMRYAGQGYLEHNYSKWMSALHRSMDIVIDNHSDMVLRGYGHINNDIVQIDKMRKSLSVLKNATRDVDRDARYLIESEIIRIEEELTKLTAHGKKYVNLVIIDSKEIPEFDFRHFDKKYNVDGMNIGYDAFDKAKKDIIRAIEFASENL